MKPMLTIQTKVLVGILTAILALLATYANLPKKLQVPPTFGALAGPDIASPYLQWGGVYQWNASAAFAQGTTTLCAIQSPASTSTLVSATARIDFGSTTAMMVEIGKSAVKNATTTSLAFENIPGNAQGNVIATTSFPTLFQDGVMAPNSWINFNAGFANSNPVGAQDVPTGTCSVVFRQI